LKRRDKDEQSNSIMRIEKSSNESLQANGAIANKCVWSRGRMMLKGGMVLLCVEMEWKRLGWGWGY